MIHERTAIVNDEGGLPNFSINECLAFLKESLLPLITRDLMADKELSGAFVDFIDVVASHWEGAGLVEGRANDPEEFVYQETMLHVFNKVSVVAL
jgi:hypothetical protein